ncbi:hypothetical protein D5F51_21260 [Yersinia hibernica]|uniref:Uncharacterized protein n=1 Tax=Yersinia hibernica TaxID=2339259 RepID=A0ABX5R596_9GAMM|nr:hypothetical protein D5F51_21260 [Yersinia hibernica]
MAKKNTLQVRVIMIIIVVLSDEAIKVGVHMKKARHCSHCFQCLLSQPGAGFFFAYSHHPLSLTFGLTHSYIQRLIFSRSLIISNSNDLSFNLLISRIF